jgi:ribosome-binding protein aMBF1 (putative translation factor)
MSRQTPTNLATLVRQARAESGLSQVDFAHLLGKSQAVISRYEAGNVSPPGQVVMHCMHIFEKSAQAQPPAAPEDWKAVIDALNQLTQAVQAMGLRRTVAAGETK